METTKKMIRDVMEDVKKLADLKVIHKVSEMNGKKGQIYDLAYEIEVNEFERNHNSVISSMGVGIKPDWTDEQCRKVFPRVDVCTMTGKYIDIICARSADQFARYKVDTNAFLSLFANNLICGMIREISAANLANAALAVLNQVGAF